MKTTILVTVLAMLLSVTNIYAGKPQAKTYSNLVTTETGYIKEYVSFSEDSQVESKTDYHYSADGYIQERVTYKWNQNKGWIAIQKYDYEYTDDHHVAYLVYTKWDDKHNAWSKQSEQLNFVYNVDGKCIATRSNQMDNTTGNLVSQR